MISCYFINHNNVKNREEIILSEIESLNPDLIIGLCLEEFNYHYIFGKMMNIIQPYLNSNRKTMKLIAPYIDVRPVPDNIIVEDSYGYYHWASPMVINCIKNNTRFVFNDNPKLFTNYNNNPKYERALLVDQLAANHLLQHGIVTFKYPDRVFRNPVTNEDFEWKYHDGSVLIDEEDFELNSKPKYIATEYPKSYINSGCIDIVSESTYGVGQYFFTEKTAKPIGALKPFIIFGPPNINNVMAEKFSMELYNEFFDYSFDREEDVHKRIEGIIQNLLRLHELPKDELRKRYNSIEDKLVNNRLAYVKIFNEMKFIPESLKFLKKNNDVKLYGSIGSNILDINNWRNK